MRWRANAYTLYLTITCVLVVMAGWSGRMGLRRCLGEENVL